MSGYLKDTGLRSTSPDKRAATKATALKRKDSIRCYFLDRSFDSGGFPAGVIGNRVESVKFFRN